MSFKGEFIEEKSALEEVGNVLQKLIKLEASIEEIKASNEQILTSLNKLTSQGQEEMVKIYTKGQIESELLLNSEASLDSFAASSAVFTASEKINFIQDIRLASRYMIFYIMVNYLLFNFLEVYFMAKIKIMLKCSVNLSFF
jgi:hypothetical protein